MEKAAEAYSYIARANGLSEIAHKVKSWHFKQETVNEQDLSTVNEKKDIIPQIQSEELNERLITLEND